MAENNNTLARPYARALFELARGRNALADWSAALALAAQVAGDEAIAPMINNPNVSDTRLLGLLQSVMQGIDGAELFAESSNEGSNFLRLLIENDRLGVLSEISTHFDELKDAEQNTVDVTITTASAMSNVQQNEITDALAKKLGRTISVTTAIDEDLIGGAVVRAGDFVIDGSVRSQLNKLSTSLGK